MMKPIKLVEHTYGTHIYMRLITESNRVEEIDVYIREDGEIYYTSADNNPANTGNGVREEIIRAFKALY